MSRKKERKRRGVVRLGEGGKGNMRKARKITGDEHIYLIGEMY